MPPRPPKPCRKPGCRNLTQDASGYCPEHEHLAEEALLLCRSLSIAFGDFKRAYLIYRRRGMRIIRDNITNKGFISFWVTERFGGGVQNFEAVKLMKFSAS